MSSVYALREALALVCEEGIENVQKRHANCAQRLYQGLESLGLQLYVQDVKKRIPTVTTVKVPSGIEWTEVTKYLMSK